MDDFETYRSLLFGIAYRMLGSVSDAEDILQDAYLRYAGTPVETIRSPRAFLSTIVTRLCLNHLSSARASRETYIGPWLPEPLLTDRYASPDSADHFDDPDSISMAFLVLLESLTPVARAVFLLREVFDYDYAEIAQMVDRSEDACRQIFSRARKEIAGRQKHFTPAPEAHRRLLAGFVQAVGAGDLKGLTDLLTEDVALWTDGGGKARGAATRALHGRERVAAFLIASPRFIAPQDISFDMPNVNGEPAIVMREHGRAVLVMTFEIDAGRIQRLRFIANPDKLQRL